MIINADLHIHSRYSGATSDKMNIETISLEAPRKGIDVMATGDCLHSGWIKEIKTCNVIDDGTFEMNGTRFILSTEVEGLHRVHHLLYFPCFSAVDEFKEKIMRHSKNLETDGRPNVNLSGEDIASFAKDVDALIGPAHAFTPIIFDPYAGPEENPFFTIPLEFWVLVNDGEITFSPVPNQSPFTPEIDGPTSGKAGIEYDYTFVTDDPEDDDVFYYIDWGDGTHENWAGPYASGVDATISHTYDEEGDYVIGAKANDVFDDESDWGYLEVTMPINQHSFHSLFIWFLECFPNAFPIFRHLIGL